MRGRRIINVTVLFSVVLIVSVVLASGIVDVPLKNVLSPGGVEPLSPGPKVAVNPAKIIKDYVLEPGYQIGNKFTLKVNVSSVSDLFTWQVNITWNPAILNFSKVKVYGPFLHDVSHPNGTSGWINQNPLNNVTIVVVNYVKGHASIAETILDSSPGAVGVSGSGDLVELEFKVVGYGCSTIVITKIGILPTTLLDSLGAGITPFDTGDSYFKNKLRGDANGDRAVNSLDWGKVNAHWAPAGGAPPGSLGYNRDVDCNDDGYINSLDWGVVNANWGRSC